MPENAGRSLSLYPLLAPHLGRYTASAGNQLGIDNVAWVKDGALFARDGTGIHVLCLVSSTGFARTSVGFVGDSDGWTDLHLHQAMTWEYTSAGPGAVALIGELLAPERTLAGTLALGFGTDAEQARAAAQAALNAGIDPAKNALIAQWQDRARTLTIPGTSDGLSSELIAALQQSATVLHANEDRHNSGAIVASLATPWGDQTNDAGGYHMVWCRDSCETALALAALGDLETGARLLGFLAERQDKNPLSPNYGSWARCYFIDGSSLAGLQLDEIAFPVLLAAKLTELGADLPKTILDMIHRATTFLVRSGPASGVDRWEETQGTSPFSLALIVVALIATAQTMLQDPEKSYALSVADNWNERLEEFTYVSGGVLDRAFDTAGHYVRIGGPADQVRLSNQLQQDVRVSAELMVGLEFLYLARLGLRDPADQRITDTLKIVDRMLARETLAGEAFCRYDLDGYGEWIDGSGWPVRQFGIGRPWPLLVGERGHYELLIGQDVKPRLDAMLKMRGRGGLIPEQIWDAGDLPWRNLANGHPTGSAMPLAWAHSELIKLAVTATTGKRRPMERLTAVENYYPDRRPKTTTKWHWRDTGPVLQLPAGCTLAIEDTQPFTLHYAFDRWRPGTVAEKQAEVLPFNLYGVTFAADQLAGHTSLQFTRRYPDGHWEGTDHNIMLEVARPTTPALRRPR